eukprot:m.908 g.908  ORF g.908 m.908 type:complete len:436 (+) comp5122_c0_seq1:68-1375(+)
MWRSALFNVSRRYLKQKYVFRKMFSQLEPELQGGKLLTPEFHAISSELQNVSKLFTKYGYELRLVGGAVRDLLLGLQPKDVDLATDATPEEMTALCEAHQLRYIETGLQHGTLTLHIGKKNFEVTTLRIDRVTDGRHAQVDFTTDWRQDAERRDLTINAMYLGFDGTLYDYFDGHDDLRKRKVAFVGHPQDRIQEDYLRILRYFRFYGRIAEKSEAHDADTLKAIQENVDGLRKISTERIWMEVSKIVVGNFAPDLMVLMYKLGVARAIGLPESGNLEEFCSVYARMKRYGPKPVSLLVSLYHSAEEVDSLAGHWKLSNVERRLGEFIVSHRQPKPHANPVKPYQSLIVLSPSEKRDEHMANTAELLRYTGKYDLAEQIASWDVPVFPVTGKDLKAMGIKPGPVFKDILAKLKAVWIDKDFTPTKDELLQCYRDS